MHSCAGLKWTTVGSSPAPADTWTEATALSTVVVARHALMQNLRRGHYDTVADEPLIDQLRLAIDALAFCL